MSELSPEEKRKIYEEEKAKLEARKEAKNEGGVEKREGANKIIWIIVIVIFASVFVKYLISWIKEYF